jgi:ankyrin repeat protein
VGDVSSCKALLEQKVDLHLPIADCGGCTPLIHACNLRKYDIVELLIKNGAPLKGVTCSKLQTRGYTVFHYAVTSGFPIKILQILLERCSHWAFNDEAVHPLHIAVANDGSPALEILLQNYQDQSARISEERIKSKFEQEFKAEAIRPLPHLIPVDVHIKTSSTTDNTWFPTIGSVSGTPLHIASSWGNSRAIQTLLRYGASVESRDKYGMTPLHLASKKGHVDVMKQLLDQGANPNARNKQLQTPSMLAAMSGGEESLALLKDAGADFTIRDNWGFTTLAYPSSNGGTTVLAYLLKERDSLSCESSSGEPYLHDLFERPSRAMSTFLLNADVDITIHSQCHGGIFNIVSLKSATLLKHMLRKVPPADITRLLQERPTATNSALYRTATIGTPGHIQLLLEAGAALELEGGPHGTPLMGACEGGIFDNVKFLVRRGAKLMYQNNNGETKSAIVMAKYHPLVTRWLLVTRYTEQDKIRERADVSTEAMDTSLWTGLKIVEISLLRAYGLSLIAYLQERRKEERKYFGKVYYPM